MKDERIYLKEDVILFVLGKEFKVSSRLGWRKKLGGREHVPVPFI